MRDRSRPMGDAPASPISPGSPAARENALGERLGTRELFLLLACVLACRVLAIRACPVYDDAFITYRYARNLAEGGAMVFNPGASWEPVLGTTTPLYGYVLSWFARMGLDLVLVSRAFNIACDLGSALLLAHGFGLRRVSATLAVIGFAALPALARISVGGMEAPLFALLALGAAAAMHAGRPGWAGVLAALDCVVRPEGVLLVLVLGVPCFARPRELLRFVVPVGAIGLAALAILNRGYGFPVPQSMLAKAHMKAGAWERVVTILQQSFAPMSWTWVLLPLVAWGFVALVRRESALRGFVLFALGVTASYLLARPHVWGWYFYVPLTAWIAALALGLELALERWFAARARWSSLLRPSVLAPATAALALLASLRLPSPIPDHVYAPMQAWARATSEREPAARILASDIGAIGWAWKGTVLDSEGLTWPAALDYPHPNAIIHGCKPEYLLVVAERDRVVPLQQDAEIVASYEPIERFSPIDAVALTPAAEELPPRWAQDYLVYRRRR